MARRFKDYLMISLKGVAMGAADTVPGVSGGTIAFISGIYEELITSISRIDFSLVKTWKKKGLSAVWGTINGNFLTALLVGILFSVFTIMRLTKYLLDQHPIMIWSFFFGLVLASIWFVGRQIKRWDLAAVMAVVVSAGLAYWITRLSAGNSHISGDWFLFIAGSVAVCAMILPGISGAFIFVLMGAYEDVTEAVADFDLKKLIIAGLGMITGLLLFSKILNWLFSKYERLTLAALTGFIAGSLNKVWPWKQVLESKIVHGESVILAEKTVWPGQFEGDPMIIQAIVFFSFGFVIIFGLESLAHKYSNPHGANPNV